MAASLSETGVRDEMNVCQLCGSLENLSLCAGCRGSWYCSKAHQREDWRIHKITCKKRKIKLTNSHSPTESGGTNIQSVMHDKIKSKSEIFKMKNSDSSDALLSDEQDIESLCKVHLRSDSSDSQSSLLTNNGNRSHSSISNKKSNNDADFSGASGGVGWKKPQNGKSQKKSGRKKQKYEQHGNFPDEASLSERSERYYLNHSTHKLSLPSSLKAAVSRQVSAVGDGDTFLSPEQCKDQYLSILDFRFKELAKYVVDSLTRHGICVIDKFLGEITGHEILNEVMKLDKDGIMKQGQLVHGTSSSSNTYIRGDVITWVDGNEPESENIHFLISCMDAVMIESARHLKQHTINERTKAMVACYPGRRTRYVRHVDNPSGDGRCVTCIYYLNKDWDVRVHGGLLRIFPEGEERVANIEPRFDRLLFFWSDRRNPHEVEEAFKERYAITVWYYDAEERAEALKHFKGRPDPSGIRSQGASLTSNNGGQGSKKRPST